MDAKKAGAALGGLILALGCAGAGETYVPPTPTADGEPPLTVLTVTERKHRCQLTAIALPGAQARQVAPLGACPEPDWSVVAPRGGRPVLYDAHHLWRLGGPDVAAPVDGIDAVAFEGADLVTCAEAHGAQRTEARGSVTWRLDGRTYRTERADGEHPILARSWALDGGRLEGAQRRARRPGGGRGRAVHRDGRLAARQAGRRRRLLGPADADDWHTAPPDVVAALAPLHGDRWVVNGAGYAAVTSMWFAPPVAWQPAGAWAQVPGLGAGTEASYVVRGPWLLVNEHGRASVRDVRTGAVAWTGRGRAVVWPDAAPLVSRR
ncbi:MAG: hypothetical protein R3F59_25760 [Myxococcota bacterium]